MLYRVKMAIHLTHGFTQSDWLIQSGSTRLIDSLGTILLMQPYTYPYSHTVHVVEPSGEYCPVPHGAGVIVALPQYEPPGHVRHSNWRLAGSPGKKEALNSHYNC